MCALVCIGACIDLYFSLYRSVFDCIGLVLVNVLASVMARVENNACIWSVFARITISYMPNTNVIHANTCWYFLARIAIHTNICTMYLACIMVCIVVCIESARIIIQYIRNTNTKHNNTDWYVLNTCLLVLTTCWHVFNTYHQYIPQYIPQYMPMHSTRIGMCWVASVAITDVLLIVDAFYDTFSFHQSCQIFILCIFLSAIAPNVNLAGH